VQAVRAPWTTSSFLLYAGGLAILGSMVALLQSLSSVYGKPAFVLWALLVVVVMDGVAWVLRERRPLVAGLIVVSGVVALAVFVGAVESWFGWLAGTDSPFAGFHVGNMVVAAVLLADALFALRVWRFPLLVFVACVSAWYLVTDILSSGGNWTATVTVAFGVLLLLLGLGLDRVYGFWVHVVAGLTIGGGILYFWHSSDTDWILVAIASLAFVALGAALERSSYAVLAAVGLFLTTVHFVGKWASLSIPFIGDGQNDRPWLRALIFAAYGVVLMLLGLWVARRRGEHTPPSA
jgi:hypothetical protein